jgi:tetratricopeptide (TPR) repeat protein
LGHSEAEAGNHVNLGLLAEAQQDFEQAAQELVRALELDKQVENRQGIAADLANLGRVSVRRGFQEAGLQYLDRAYRSYAAQGDRKRAVEELSTLVELVRESGKPEELHRYETDLNALKETPARDDMKGRRR